MKYISIVKLLLLSLCLLLNFYYCEPKTTSGCGVSGTVIDENSMPFVGATVVQVGKPLGTITGLDGTFSLWCNGSVVQISNNPCVWGYYLEISAVGYESQQIPIPYISGYPVNVYVQLFPNSL